MIEAELSAIIVLIYVAFVLIRFGLFRMSTSGELNAPPSAHGSYPPWLVLRGRRNYFLSGVALYCLGLVAVFVIFMLATHIWFS